MRQIYICLLLLAGLGARCQKLEYAENGKVTNLGIKDNKLQDAPTTLYTALDKKKKKEWRELLKKQVDETIANLADPSTRLKDFYDWVGHNTVAINTDLLQLSLSLDQVNKQVVVLPLLPALENAIDDYLRENSAVQTYYQDLSSTDFQKKIRFRDLYNKLLIDYYNKTLLFGPANNIRYFSLEQWYRYTRFLATAKKTTDSLLQVVYESPAGIDLPLFQQIRRYTRTLNADATFVRIKNLLKNDWFKDWIWMHSGVPRLNPLDFSTDQFLAKYPQYDAAKAEIYDRYIDSVLNRFIRYDTAGKIDQFKKILAEKGEGANLFKLTERQQKEKENNEALQKLLVTDKLLNEISIPDISEKEKNDYTLKGTDVYFYNYSYSKKDKFKTTWAGYNSKFLTEPVITETTKKIVVHNIPAEGDAEITTKTSPIVDSSEFQNTTNTFVGLAADIAAFVTKLTPFGRMVPGGFINPDNSVVMTVASGPAETRIVTGPTTSTVLKTRLQDPNNYLYDAELFNKLISLAFFATKGWLDHARLDQVFDQRDPTDVYLINRLQKEYIALLQAEKKVFWDQLREDSMHLAYMIPAFSQSSIPPPKLKEKKDDIALYHSKVLLTEPGSDPVKNDITVVALKGKESASIAKFSYKTGKTYRFQLGAGIAYTTSNFILSSATEENGKITIKNVAQHYRLIAGIHVHLGKGLFVQDNSFPGNFLQRSAVYIGVGIPEALENIYTGYSYDFFPGLKTTAGLHIYAQNDYKIQNNSIIEQRKKYKAAGLFFALQIDPSSLLKALNIIKP